jgi:protein-disulfide isomerase
MRRLLPVFIIGVVLLAAAAGGFLLYRAKTATTPLKIVEGGQPGAEPAYVRGGGNASVTLEEFGDYQCAPCGRLASTLLTLEHDYGSRIRLVFRQFPLAKVHAHALAAASAAEAAGLQGHFWEMHDLLFANARSWGEERPIPLPRAIDPSAREQAAAEALATFDGYASKIGLDLERFKKDMASEQVRERIRADFRRGDSIGVDRTPALFLNRVSIPFDSFNVPALHKLIDQALNGQTPVPESPTPTPSPSPATAPSNLEPASSPSP